MGSARPDHICKACLPKIVGVEHISESYIGKPFWCEREFIPKSDTFGIVKDTFGIVKEKIGDET